MSYLYDINQITMMPKSARLLVLFMLINIQMYSQDPGAHKGFYGSFAIGPGIVHGNITSAEIKTTLQFAMHISVGYFFTNSIQAGITGCGWLFEPYGWTGSDYKGESLANTMLYIQVYPTTQNRVFLKGGYGMSSYTNLRSGNDYGQGYGIMAGAGIEKPFKRNELLFGIQLSVQFGKLKYGQLYTAPDQTNRSFYVVDFTLFIGLD